MSSLCTCHIDRSSCEWCRVQTIKSFFQKQQREKPSSYVGEMLWMATKLEDYMIKAVARQLKEEPQYSNYAETCGSCRFFHNNTDFCSKHQVYKRHKDIKCDDWRYFA